MRKGKTFTVMIICFLTIAPALACIDAPSIELPLFSIALLSPNTNEARNKWAVLMQEQLPKIGIGVYLHESTGWDNIAPRSWSYPLIDYDYIPTHAEGGFDALFIGWDWEMDFNPIGHYDVGWLPFSDNYYQYSNVNYDNKLKEYLTTYNPDERDQLAAELQAILYEDLPAISILYESSFFLVNHAITGFNPLLNKVRSDHSENWKNSEGTGLAYSTKFEPKSNNAFQLEKENIENGQNFDSLWAQCVYGSLYQRNQTNNRWNPYIARNATIIPNYYESDYIHNISVVVDIDPEAKFSNGESVLAEDIKYSYDLHLSTSAHLSTYNHLIAKYISSNDSVAVIDSDTVKFDLNKVCNFPFNLLSYGLIDKSTVEPIISTYGHEVLKEAPFSENTSDSLIISCGPFKLDSYNITENKVVLTQNEYWFGQPPVLANITFVSIPDEIEARNSLRRRLVNILDDSYNFIEGMFRVDDNSELMEPFEFATFPSLQHQEIGINMRHPILGRGELTPAGTVESAKAIRKAISHAIPREYIINDILGGPGVEGVKVIPPDCIGVEGITPVPPGCIGFNSSLVPYEYDISIAVDYMESAGYQLIELPCEPTNLLLIPSLISLVSIIVICRKKT
ncbi:MAG: ABC transporter substrate-binding protein [Candidatus Heimdallarchaeaceae archaeon]